MSASAVYSLNHLLYNIHKGNYRNNWLPGLLSNQDLCCWADAHLTFPPCLSAQIQLCHRTERALHGTLKICPRPIAASKRERQAQCWLKLLSYHLQTIPSIQGTPTGSEILGTAHYLIPFQIGTAAGGGEEGGILQATDHWYSEVVTVN